MIEVEKKMLLFEEEYKHLMAYFGGDKSVTKQVNYYYDTDDLQMDKQNITCRLRFKNGIWKGTMKKHHLNGDANEETTVEVYDSIYDNTFTREGLALQGELVTYRIILLKNDVCEVVLDRNTYLDYTDYELEIEYASGYEQNVWVILQNFTEVLRAVLPSLSALQLYKRLRYKKSKSRRFFDRMKQKWESQCSP